MELTYQLIIVRECVALLISLSRHPNSQVAWVDINRAEGKDIRRRKPLANDLADAFFDPRNGAAKIRSRHQAFSPAARVCAALMMADNQTVEKSPVGRDRSTAWAWKAEALLAASPSLPCKQDECEVVMFGLGGRAGRTTLELEKDQALVPFELLSRWIDDAPQPTPSAECFQSPAELVVLKQLDLKLKAALSEPFRSDYLEVLSAARDRLSEEIVVGEILQD